MLPVHALELLGVGVAPGHHAARLAMAPIGLPERHIMLLRQLGKLQRIAVSRSLVDRI